MSDRVSSGNLSAAAAAAALRSHTTSPVPVGQIQTKRMLQRQTSTSSIGSAAGRNARPGALKRSDSGSSMTERTFRDPSPARRPQSRSIEDVPPPIPQLPKVLASPPPLPERSIRRPASVEPPERIGSPPPKVPGGRGVSLDRGPGVMKGRLNRAAAQRPPSLSTFQEVEQSGGRGSINFSRPRSPTSSPVSPISRDVQMSPTPEGRRTNAKSSMAGTAALTAAEVEQVQYSMQDIANSPVKKKTKTIVPAMVEGSHLSNGTTGVKPTGTALQKTSQQQQNLSATSTPSPARSTSPLVQPATPNISAVRKKKKNTANTGASARDRQSGRLSDYASDSDAGSEQSYTSDRSRSYNTRAAGLLTKQPSIVREDREAEEEEERGSPVVKGEPIITQSKHKSNPADATVTAAQSDTAAVKDTASTTPAVLQKQPTLALENAPRFNANGAPKRSSLSPARVAHFPDQPLLDTPEGLKHQPPGRSLSPAKSALKHSPSSRGTSPGNTMPGGWTRPGQVPSEASDTASVVSDDGYKSLSRKKQNRVSFDDVPSVVGRSDTSPSSPDSPIIFSPQSKDSVKKGWFSLGREKKKEQSTSGKDEDVIKPMPTLPSFGSVRGRKGPEEHTVVATSSESPSEPVPLGTSDDFNIGGILAQHYGKKANDDASKKASNEPLPPEVTSVEGSGYHSDEDTDHDVNEENVPKISVQPATPGLDESSQQQLGASGDNRETTEPISRSKSMFEDEFAIQTPSSMGIAEPEPPAVAAYHDPASPVVGEVAHSLQHQINPLDEDDTEESIYSDAPEDMSDLEGDGFGSINAIVESPTVSTFPASPKSPITPQVQSLSPLPDNEVEEPQSVEGWDKAQAYWSGLSQSRKSQLEDEASPSAVDAVTSAPASQPKKMKKVIPKNTAQLSQPQFKPLAARDIEQKPKSEVPPMKKSMRDGPVNTPEVPHMRSSMRGAPPQKPALKQTTMRNSLPSSAPLEPKGALQKKLRPVSAVAMVDYNKPGNGTNNPRSASGGNQAQSLTPVAPAKKMTSHPTKKAAVVASAPRRTFSNGSDSSSSFKKARPIASDSGRYSMRRSMRASSVSEESRPAPVQSSRFSVRSLSPGSHNRNTFNPPPPSGGMRSSMRGSADPGNNRPPKSPTRSFGFGRSSKAAAASAKPSSRFSSRFGDSSDDDDGPSTYRGSRFADSSDEDELPRRPADLKLTPVRGIPRRIDEGDSTDLEDSADERVTRRKKTPTSPPATKLEGVALASGSLRANGAGQDLSKTADMGSGLQVKKAAEKSQKKRSFFGSLGRGKTDDSKIQKADVESAARRDTPLERSKPERALVATSPAAQSPKSPKLQRRNTPQRFASDSWPLPPTTTVGSERPMTSDGLPPTGKRPGLGERQGTAGSVAVSLRTGKKKRFPRLRRAFGLHD